ncbi:hypothetical protein H8A95_33385 [Bradyrhizobium sp. Pear76]|uniref:Zn-ribbon domain-containing OB-fold protein n=1 Tax=Bradyrhizobium oropedii TaxID=1571201 RepID=UPI001E5D56EE|nr:hypothetical protein [Bradyrhizobium oropedii]MCC8967093.1 hypothetical protein [Bradyrhizobium oropedii]
MIKLLNPELYEEDDRNAVRLIGAACPTCSGVFFPMQTYGCERCGADLRPRRFAAAGTVTAQARVHLHRAANPPTPFTVVALELDDGPVIRALLTSDSPPCQIGDRLVGELVDITEPDSEPRRDLRFTRAVAQ